MMHKTGLNAIAISGSLKQRNIQLQTATVSSSCFFVCFLFCFVLFFSFTETVGKVAFRKSERSERSIGNTGYSFSEHAVGYV